MIGCLVEQACVQWWGIVLGGDLWRILSSVLS